MSARTARRQRSPRSRRLKGNNQRQGLPDRQSISVVVSLNLPKKNKLNDLTPLFLPPKLFDRLIDPALARLGLLGGLNFGRGAKSMKSQIRLSAMGEFLSG